jgi:TolB-like protein
MKKKSFLKGSGRGRLDLTFCFFLLPFFALLLSPSEGFAAQASGVEKNGSKEKIAVFEFENLTESSDALAYVMPAVTGLMESRGFALLDEKSLDDFLIKERVRTTAYVSGDLAQKMEKELKVSAILLGTVYTFSMDANPQLGLSARLVDSSNGEILWSAYASATGADFTTILGLGTLHSMEELLPQVMKGVFASFSTEPPIKLPESTYRIAVMPFLNKSDVRGIGMLPTYMVMVQLFKNPVFVPVEFGGVRSAIINSRIMDRGEIDYKSIGELSDVLNVDGILVGTVELYSVGNDNGIPPGVAISARLINARQNRLVWCDSYQMDGDEDISILDFGKIRSVDKVAYRVISQLIKKMEKTEWK